MVSIQILTLLAIVFCFTVQNQASPLALREINEEGEETDREFEDAFDAALKEEVAREFIFENDREARNSNDGEGESKSSFLDDRQEASGEETDREFEDAFDAALKGEVVRELKFENDREAHNFNDGEGESQSSYLDAKQEEAVGEETDREFEDAFDAALKEEVSQNFEDKEEINEDDQSEAERQVAADIDNISTSSEVTKDDQQSEHERQEIDIASQKEERQMSDVKPRATNDLKLNNMLIRPMLTKRCQGQVNISLNHCAKYLACGTAMFRGNIKTCKSGELFDAVLKKCNDSDKVDCKIRT